MSLPMEIETRTPEIQQRIEAMGAELIEISFRKASHRAFLTLLVDKPGGRIGLEDCARINKALSPYFDEFVSGPYFLEVNSPGLDRPLKTPKDFLKAKGEPIRVVYLDAENPAKNYTVVGEMVSVNDNELYLKKREAANLLRLSFSSILRAVREIRVS
jgi:ribosome maturation factor RimP